MHSALNRLQTTFGFFTTCAFTLAGIIAFLSLLPFPAPTGSPAAKINQRDVQVVKGRPHYYSTKREEYAVIRFDLDADLSPLFTWNTKQLFVYVTANYPSASGKGVEQSESVIWDLIIPATATPWSFQTLRNIYFPSKKYLLEQKREKKRKPTTKAVSLPGRLNLKNQKPKYQITDPSGKMGERSNVTLQVSWNVQPWVGALTWDKGYLGSRTGAWKAGRAGRSTPFEIPPLKGSKAETVREQKTPAAGEALPVNDL